MNYEKRIVAFIDVLGFKNMISDTLSDEKLLDRVYNAMKANKKLKDTNYGDTFENMNVYGVEITVFSDSIVISYPASHPGGLFFLLMDCVYICLDLLYMGLIVRGGITYGDLIHEQSVCFGPAMVQAYQLESQYAKYPRIIVDNTAYTIGLQNPSQSNNEEYEKQFIDSLLLQDDDYLYLDYLSQRNEFDYPEDFYYCLQKMKNIIEKNMNNQNPSIQSKYTWLKNYFNHVASNNGYMDLLIP